MSETNKTEYQRKFQNKLLVHLVHIVSPIGVPLTGKQQLQLCAAADRAQRLAAVDRARVKVPFLLPDEEDAAQKWVDEVKR